jgi:hypothetical protein
MRHAKGVSVRAVPQFAPIVKLGLKNVISRMENINQRACPHCGCLLRADRYEHHLAMQHSQAAEEKKALLRAKLQEEQVRRRIEGARCVTCDICRVSVKARNLDRHTRKVHQTAISRHPQDRSSQKKGVTLVRAPCTCRGENENCFKCFGTGLYEKELIANPPSSPLLPITRNGSSKKSRTLGGFASDFRGDDYSIREGGRFSSSPLHDDYGDESSS